MSGKLVPVSSIPSIRCGKDDPASLVKERKEIMVKPLDGVALPAYFRRLGYERATQEIMAKQWTALEQAIQADPASRPSPHEHAPWQRIDVERCQNFMQAVLDGREQVLSVCQAALRLKCPERFLKSHFPLECEQRRLCLHSSRSYFLAKCCSVVAQRQTHRLGQ